MPTGGERTGLRRAGGALWTFLNSAFGLFLLSSVVLAGLGRLYSDHEARQRLASERRAEAVRLVSEIGLRAVWLQALSLRNRELLDQGGDDGRGKDDAARIKERVANAGRMQAIIRGNHEVLSAPEYKGVHLSALIRRNDILLGVDSGGALAIQLSAFDAFDFGPMIAQLTQPLLTYWTSCERGLSANELPVLPGDRAGRQRFAGRQARDSAASRAIAAQFAVTYDLLGQVDDAEYETIRAFRDMFGRPEPSR